VICGRVKITISIILGKEKNISNDSPENYLFHVSGFSFKSEH
jgi:hypothetical protein